jgi:hypothetical protein
MDKEDAKAVSAADQENAKRRDERAASPDGMTASERAMAESEPASKDKGRTRSMGEIVVEIEGDDGWDRLVAGFGTIADAKRRVREHFEETLDTANPKPARYRIIREVETIEATCRTETKITLT